MVIEMTSELWYELERVEMNWYEVSTQQLSFSNQERIQKLNMLVKIGLVKWWDHEARRHGFYAITDQGREALAGHRFGCKEKPDEARLSNDYY
jgi:DNA-binding PadR family transcriptional regulator